MDPSRIPKLKGDERVDRATQNAEEGKEHVGESGKHVLEARGLKNFKQKVITSIRFHRNV